MALTPQFQKLIASCQEMQLSHLRPLVDRMFENADIALLDFAEKAESNTAQSVFFEAMNEVKKKRKAIEHAFFSELNRSYAEFPSSPNAKEPPPDPENILEGLSLIDTDEMETSVATLNATGKLASRIMDRIFALKQRLSVINGGDSIDESQIPGGPAWLGSAYQRAVAQLDLENKVRLVFIVLFDKYVLSQVDSLFDEYNKRLIMADILPNLRYEVRKQAGGIEIVEKTVNNPSEHDREVEDGAESMNNQTPSELGDELFGRICELMAGRNPVASSPGAGPGKLKAVPGSSGTAAGGSSAATGAMLLSQLTNVQSSVRTATSGVSSSEFIENIEIDESFLNRLQSTLVEERERIFGGIDRRQLPEADNNVIELVGMLFEYMLKEEALPNLVKALLSRLHTPLLKVAVLDKQFFTRTQHPARKLLNDMTSAGIRWVDESQIDRSVFPKMKEIVDRVLVEFDHDVTVFDNYAAEFDSFVKELRQRAELVEQRTSEAANGQDKLLAARRRAKEAINGLFKEKQVGDEARDFIQKLWADKLTFILLRNADGDESSPWLDSIGLAGRIVDSCIPPHTEQQRASRSQDLVDFQKEIREATRTLQQADKEKLLLALFRAQSKALEKVVAESAIKPAPQPEVMPDPEPAEPVKPAPTSTPEQERMIVQLKSVPFGTWFEFSDENNVKHRAKLSWRSTVTEKFMFVDQMGVKAAVISMHELADNIISGKVTIVSAEKKPFVDRALSAIHKMLDRGTKAAASA